MTVVVTDDDKIAAVHKPGDFFFAQNFILGMVYTGDCSTLAELEAESEIMINYDSDPYIAFS